MERTVKSRQRESATLNNFAGSMLSIICGIFGNTWYLAHAKREIARIRALGLQDDAHYWALARRGGTNVFASLGLFLLFVVAVFIVTALAIVLIESIPELTD